MNTLPIKSTIVFAILFTLSAYAQVNMPLQKRAQIARNNLYKNISPPGTKPGVVVASPSRSNPDYFYHWVRDAALVMVPVLQKYKSTLSIEVKNALFNKFHNFINFSRSNQLVNDADPRQIDIKFIMGEPKFTVQGGAYNKGWGRPQNDGPALRAITLIQYAEQLIKEGKVEYVRNNIYRPEIPAYTVVKADLEYTAHHLNIPVNDFTKQYLPQADQNRPYGYYMCSDYWEEVKDFHITTLMAQRKALVLGAKIAGFFKDYGAAKFYNDRAKLASMVLESFWSPSENIIGVSLDRSKLRKYSGLDVATILGTLHSEVEGQSYNVHDPRVHATALAVKNVFNKFYDINKKGFISTAIGRYPEDVYDGNGFNGGNPWFLAIHAFAELNYRIASRALFVKDILISPVNHAFFMDLKHLDPKTKKMLGKSERIFMQDPRFMKIINALILEGDDYIKRSAFHANQETASMAEQINRYHGSMQGARDLTWSYASLLTALHHKGIATQRLEVRTKQLSRR